MKKRGEEETRMEEEEMMRSRMTEGSILIFSPPSRELLTSTAGNRPLYIYLLRPKPMCA